MGKPCVASTFRWLHRVPAKATFEKRDLVDYLTRAEVTYKPLPPGRAKRAANGATDLGGNANGAPLTAGAGIPKEHQSGFDGIIVFQPKKDLVCLCVG
jgi:hypothetical protein